MIMENSFWWCDYDLWKLEVVFALITDVKIRICGLCRDYIPSGKCDSDLWNLWAFVGQKFVGTPTNLPWPIKMKCWPNKFVGAPTNVCWSTFFSALPSLLCEVKKCQKWYISWSKDSQYFPSLLSSAPDPRIYDNKEKLIQQLKIKLGNEGMDSPSHLSCVWTFWGKK